MASRCYECGEMGHHGWDCTQPLLVKRVSKDEEGRRLDIMLERCNAKAADALRERGIHPHFYRSGDGASELRGAA